jgi:hypothetical protein
MVYSATDLLQARTTGTSADVGDAASSRNLPAHRQSIVHAPERQSSANAVSGAQPRSRTAGARQAHSTTNGGTI